MYIKLRDWDEFPREWGKFHPNPQLSFFKIDEFLNSIQKDYNVFRSCSYRF